MLKLKLQYFGHLMERADSFEETLMLGNIEGRRSYPTALSPRPRVAAGRSNCMTEARGGG